MDFTVKEFLTNLSDKAKVFIWRYWDMIGYQVEESFDFTVNKDSMYLSNFLNCKIETFEICTTVSPMLIDIYIKGD